jgi:hypothetical protein
MEKKKGAGAEVTSHMYDTTAASPTIGKPHSSKQNKRAEGYGKKKFH